MDLDPQQGPALDYESLRQEGIALIQRLAGQTWTDHNAHDPGITILEQLCYVLTDLGYRATFDVADLLASGGSDPFESLYRPSEVLTSRPVTLADLRKLVLDVDGVKNAWIEPDQAELPLHYHAGKEEISHIESPPTTEPVELDGLYRVLIEPSDLAGIDGTAVGAAVVRRLYANRSLCQDFTQVRVLKRQLIQVHAGVQIGKVEDAEGVLVEILLAIADHLSPPVPFRTLGEMLERGHPVDEIFEGPLLRSGFIEPGALKRTERRARLSTSDLIQVIMDVPGVRAISTIAVAAGGTPEAWLLELDPGQAPQLDVGKSNIDLDRAGITVGVDSDRVVAAYESRRRRSSPTPSSLGGVADEESMIPRPGRDRSVGRYGTAQRHLPSLYGIGDLGLSASASAERRAQARQLKAYLMFFDQILANYFAQLANVRRLFSHGGEGLQTYFAQLIDDPELEEIAVRETSDRRRRLEEMTEGTAGGSRGERKEPLERKNRFLNHLLARFGEEFTDYSLSLFDAFEGSLAPQAEKLIRDKQAFLTHYAELSGGRGTAHDDSQPVGGSNRSGLEERIRLKLGLEPQENENLLLVEHILLRPIADDSVQAEPLLAAARRQDPYSLQLSVVFPNEGGRFARAAFRRLAERTVREETPAHLTPYVHWLSLDAWLEVERAYAEWLKRRRAALAPSAGLTLDRPAA